MKQVLEHLAHKRQYHADYQESLTQDAVRQKQCVIDTEDNLKRNAALIVELDQVIERLSGDLPT